jgi:hypothetical protein
MKSILAVVASTVFLSSAYAQSSSLSAAATPASSASVKSDTVASMKVEDHIKDLHAKLKITSAEETQWTMVAQAMRKNATDLDAAIEKREAGSKTATAVDDLNNYGAIAQAHADGVKELSAAFSPLYVAMSDDQKKIADELFAQRTPGMKKSVATPATPK